MNLPRRLYVLVRGPTNSRLLLEEAIAARLSASTGGSQSNKDARTEPSVKVAYKPPTTNRYHIDATDVRLVTATSVNIRHIRELMKLFTDAGEATTPGSFGDIHLIMFHNQLVGFVDIRTSLPEHSQHLGHIGISVAPPYRGIGIGTETIRQAVEELHKKGVWDVTASVKSANSWGISAICKNGFKFDYGHQLDEERLLVFVRHDTHPAEDGDIKAYEVKPKQQGTPGLRVRVIPNQKSADTAKIAEQSGEHRCNCQGHGVTENKQHPCGDKCKCKGQAKPSSDISVSEAIKQFRLEHRQHPQAYLDSIFPPFSECVGCGRPIFKIQKRTTGANNSCCHCMKRQGIYDILHLYTDGETILEILYNVSRAQWISEKLPWYADSNYIPLDDEAIGIQNKYAMNDPVTQCPGCGAPIHLSRADTECDFCQNRVQAYKDCPDSKGTPLEVLYRIAKAQWDRVQNEKKN